MSANQSTVHQIASRHCPTPGFHSEAPKDRPRQQHHQGGAAPKPSQRPAQPPGQNKPTVPIALPPQQNRGKKPHYHQQPGRLQPPAAVRGGATSHRGRGFAREKPAIHHHHHHQPQQPGRAPGPARNRSDQQQQQRGGPGSFRVVDKVRFDQFYFPVDKEEMARDAKEYGLTIGLKHSRWAPKEMQEEAEAEKAKEAAR